MRALVVSEGSLGVRDILRPTPAEGEGLVRVRLAGICGTDLEIMRGYKGFTGTLGHEFVGVVEECADQAWVGLRVCGEINIGCGNCEMCRTGEQGHCAGRTVVGILDRPGAFADFVTVP